MRGKSVMNAVRREQEAVERRAIRRNPSLRNKRIKQRELPGWPDQTKNQRRLRFMHDLKTPCKR